MNGHVLWLPSIFVHFWFILILYDSCNWSISCGTIWSGSQKAKNEKILVCLHSMFYEILPSLCICKNLKNVDLCDYYLWIALSFIFWSTVFDAGKIEHDDYWSDQKNSYFLPLKLVIGNCYLKMVKIVSPNSYLFFTLWPYENVIFGCSWFIITNDDRI